MRKILFILMLFVPLLAIPSGSWQFPGASGGSGGASAWGDITGTVSNQSDLQTELNARVADTGDETIAGVKTLSSAPICSSLTAQAMPYLNASKALANGLWTQADTTGATVFSPSGTPTVALDFVGTSLSGNWGTAFRMDGITFPSAADLNGVFKLDVNVPAGMNGRDSIAQTINVNGGNTVTTSYIAAMEARNSIDNSGSDLSLITDFMRGSFGYTAMIRNQTTGGAAVGIDAVAYNSSQGFGGVFQAIGGLGGVQVGVSGLATGENSGIHTGVFGRIAPAKSAAIEDGRPAISAAGLFDNLTSTYDILVAADNGTSTFHVADGGATTIGTIGGTSATHSINGAVQASGGGTGALTGFPTTAAPAVYLKLRINGTVYFFPGWALP